ncbi:transmembrane protein 14c [Plakobranchus ocellatus]|uniref:Transmembrane protein 14c n=1 Tax=Plakobranchus ocellatus TaxID=259542 RepID=A0AAV4CYT1_9GAST|nr:transmembrane protein 14c [Plakobranchus ocellatus]
MAPVDFITAAYAVTVAAGGIMGYVKRGSMPSLAMGVTCGSLMMYGAYQIAQDPKDVKLALVTSAILTGVMGYRFANSGKFMPAGLVGTLSLLMVCRLAYMMSVKQ